MRKVMKRKNNTRPSGALWFAALRRYFQEWRVREYHGACGPSVGKVNAEGNEVNGKVHGRERFRKVDSLPPGPRTGNAGICLTYTNKASGPTQ